MSWASICHVNLALTTPFRVIFSPKAVLIISRDMVLSSYPERVTPDTFLISKTSRNRWFYHIFSGKFLVPGFKVFA